MDTYNDIYLRARRKLRGAGITSPDLEARLIIAHVAGKTREELLSSSRLYVTDYAVTRTVDEMVDRRLAGEPVAYILGEWEFYGLPVVVSKAVLIPRVDTELLAQEAIKQMKIKSRGGQARMLDLCAGSGCIGLAVAAHVPDCRIVLADDSEQALAVCRANMLKNHLSRNVTAIEADALEPPPALLGTFDLIVSNPPYIPTRELDGLDASVRDHEPLRALDGGPDGLYFFRAITSNWPAILKPGGRIAFECGAGQADAVWAILEEGGFGGISVHKDTQGIQRVVIGTLKAAAAANGKQKREKEKG